MALSTGDRVKINGTTTTYDGKLAEVVAPLKSGRYLVAVDNYLGSSGLRMYPAKYLVPLMSAALPSPSGQSMPTTEPQGWRRVFSDDFKTPIVLGRFLQDASDWNAYPHGWHDTSRNGVYSPEKVLSVKDGMLHYWVRTENGVPYVAAPYPRIAEAPMDGCRIVVRRRCDSLPGYKTAWLLWPYDEDWPRNGEIDFPEGGLHDGDNFVAFMHRQNATEGSDQDYWHAGRFDTGWHTFVMEWRKGQSCRFGMDGALSPTFTSRVPASPMRYVMQTETEIVVDPPNPAVSGYIQVDWITVAVPA